MAMRKVTITADTVLSIVRKVFTDNDIDVITDPSFPKAWMNKSIQDVLNIKYYTFKHRPESTEMIIAEKKKEGIPVSELEALNRAFGCLTLSTVERIFSTNNDIATCDATLDFWLQTSKIKLLEYLIEKTNIALSGVVLPLDFTMEDSTTESRSASIVFGRLDAPEFDPESPIGESARCSINIKMTIEPPVTKMPAFEFASRTPNVGENWDTVMNKIPVSTYQYSLIRTYRSVPKVNKPQSTGMINLSSCKTMVFTFDGLQNIAFIDFMLSLVITNDVKDTTELPDINAPIYVRMTRNGVQSLHAMIITQYLIASNDNGTNEVHTLNLASGGIDNGIE